jgi:hypothetical protein
MISRAPPRFVPTLTEVVEPAATQAADAPAAPVAPAPVVVAELEEAIVHRVMQRVDLSLERRLREAVAAVVLEQTQHLGPRLRIEIEAVVRDCVAEALAGELPSRH